MDLMITAHIKSSYEEWKGLFDADAGPRGDLCDEARTMVGKVDERTAIIALFDVDMAALGQRLNDPEFQKMTEPYVDRHDVYTIEPMAPPG
ncbi:MAG: hypothetical protein VYD25_04765 [Pseudomonadota bacterium]|uniref:Cyclase n=1 Tax=marine metagenome TaxID=408172 RepID=A0A381UEH5_9ZZZZ|nr:hypothetical protein [Pseudomonadota bacterium]MEE3286889.1 hypothetical protein [Pseudomonadota bacterium]